jgi:hypothetical protein
MAVLRSKGCCHNEKKLIYTQMVFPITTVQGISTVTFFLFDVRFYMRGCIFGCTALSCLEPRYYFGTTVIVNNAAFRRVSFKTVH